jgi:hypothetical protein
MNIQPFNPGNLHPAGDTAFYTGSGMSRMPWFNASDKNFIIFDFKEKDIL